MWFALLQLALIASQANALLRFPCSQQTVTRSDPLVDPNGVSKHLHQVVGGSAFDFNMPSGTDLTKASCSSCSIKENKSNYWSPTLYFQSPINGTFKRVKQNPGPFTGSPNAGMVVYYIQIGTVTAFPKGFRMLSGDPKLRSYQSNIDDSRSIMFRCLQGTDTDGQGRGPDTNGMPNTNCPGGVRSQINFPTCWDGKNVQSADHKSHVKYAIGASFGNFGSGCPSTHPIQLPLLFLETYWDTNPYAKDWVNGKSPFVWSMGDPTGYGYHADYMMGWPDDVLRSAMANCNDAGGGCSQLATRSEQEMNDCATPNRVDEDLDGWLTTLPGCNPVQTGPGNATPVTGCGAPTSTITPGGASWLTNKISGWTPVGCASETGNENVLSGIRTTIAGMTVEKCVNYCNGQKYTYAGVKNRNGCVCGNSVNTSKVNTSYACNVPCDGNLNQNCGAPNRVGVYRGSGIATEPVTTPAPTISQPQTTPQPTQTQPQTTPQPSPTGAVVPKYGQCGGKDWTGGTICASGSTCKYSNDWYSQCL